jgi:hypothetical protein
VAIAKFAREVDFVQLRYVVWATCVVASATAISFAGTVGFLVVGALSTVAVLVTIALESPSATSAVEIKELLSRSDLHHSRLHVRTTGFTSACEYARDGVLVARWQDNLVVEDKLFAFRDSERKSYLSRGDERLATATPTKGKSDSFMVGYQTGTFRLEAFAYGGFPWAIRRAGQLEGFLNEDQIFYPSDLPTPIAVFAYIVARNYVREQIARSGA